MRRTLTEGQEAEIEWRYRAGEGGKALAAAYRVDVLRIVEILTGRGVAMRSKSESARLRMAASRPSAARLRDLYWGPDLPSVIALASALGFSTSTVRQWLKQDEIALRGQSEQKKSDLAKGRVDLPHRYCSPEQRAEQRAESCRIARAARTPEGMTRGMAACHTPEARGKANVTRLRQIVRLCIWCGSPLSRPQCHTHRKAHAACSRAHSSAWGMHRRWHPTAPRPLILQQITEAIAQHRSEGGEVHRTLPAKFGTPLGATDAEYDAWWGALDLTSLNDYEMTAYLDWDLDRKIREAGLQSGVSEG